MVALFTGTIVLSATLMFVVQPLFGKMVLPLLGGVPSVWSTCLVFFQTALLAGYLYSHLISTRLEVRRQLVVHGTVVLLPFAVLPLGLGADWHPPEAAGQVIWLLALMAVTVGLPFFVVATTAPLLQRWFGRTTHRLAPDPYFLYSASNVGSVAGLLAYPLAIEPWLPVSFQSAAWEMAYALLVCGVAACGVVVWRANPRSIVARPSQTRGPARCSAHQRTQWMVLSAIPASLLYGVTTYISSDLASFPLLWVVPLALYLVTFIIAFARRPIVSPRWVSAVLPLAVVAAVLSLLGSGSTVMLWIPVHLIAFFLCAMLAHGRLAASRPRGSALTEFYLWVSLGGVAGGFLNALVAPAVLVSPLEYPAMLIAACLLRFDFRRGDFWSRVQPDDVGVGVATQRRLSLDLVLPMSLGILAVVLRLGIPHADLPTVLSAGLRDGLPLMACAMLAPWRVRFSLGLGAVLLAAFLTGGPGTVLHAERNFFGVIRVVEDPEGPWHHLYHGTTLHGTQSLAAGRRLEPLSYYHRDGPLGDVFDTDLGRSVRSRVGVVGLGTGAAACHGHPDQRWTFFEIDAAIARVARDPRLFTYLRDCRPSALVVLGDGRRSLRREPDGHYSILILDAFGSDAIPIHLLTREALDLYRRRLARGGLLVVHISSRFLDLEPTLWATARSLGLRMVTRRDRGGSAEGGRLASTWCVLAADADGATLDWLVASFGWRSPPLALEAAVWTDEFAAVLTALKWSPW